MKTRILGAAALAVAGATAAQAAPINVAVIGGGSNSASDVASQLNDDTHFDFTAAVISVSDAESLSTLQAFDAVVLGDSGYGDNGWSAGMFASLRQYLDWGGGIVTAGWYSYATDLISGQSAADADYITPIADGSYSHAYDATLTNLVDHAITSGVSSVSGSGCCFEVAPGGVDAGAVSLGTINGQVAAAYQDVIGRSVYLGGLYMADDGSTTYRAAVTALRSGEGDRLLEQAVAWAAEGTVSPVPLPASLSLSFAGLALLGVAGRRRKAA